MYFLFKSIDDISEKTFKKFEDVYNLFLKNGLIETKGGKIVFTAKGNKLDKAVESYFEGEELSKVAFGEIKR